MNLTFGQIVGLIFIFFFAKAFASFAFEIFLNALDDLVRGDRSVSAKRYERRHGVKKSEQETMLKPKIGFQSTSITNSKNES